MNRVILKGFLGEDAKTFPTKKEGITGVSVSVATSQYAGKDAEGKAQYRTTWNVVKKFLKGEQAIKLAGLLQKGAMVYVEGEISYNKVEREGTTYYNAAVLADKIEILRTSGASGKVGEEVEELDFSGVESVEEEELFYEGRGVPTPSFFKLKNGYGYGSA